MTRLPRRPRLARPAQAALAALGLLTGLALGCKGGLGGDSCVSTREYFADEVWTNVMSRKCITCHGSPHTMGPATTDSDNLQAIRLQGHAGIINTCTTCHTTTPSDPFPHRRDD